MSWIRRRRCGALIALSVLLVSWGLSPSPSVADEPTTAQQPVVVVADFSGSMNEKDADDKGTSRIAAAKAAVKNLLTTTPAGSRLGLVVYGARNDSCTDVQTLNPVGDFDAAALGKKIDALQAKGNTPIGPALKHAANDLANIEGPKGIVLVSDGEPNCEPPTACEVAKQLKGQGIDLTVHTIGFRIHGNAKAQETLQCIADATGGTYTDVSNSQELTEALEQETVRALEGYQAEGQEVTGGTTLSDAEEILPGQYVMKLQTGDEGVEDDLDQEFPNRRFFAIPYQEGWDVTVTATLVPPTSATGADADSRRYLALFETTDQETYCGGKFDRESASGFLDDSDLQASITISGDEAGCVSEDGEHRLFHIIRGGDAWADHEVDIEFTVAYYRADPSADGTGQDPGAPGSALNHGTPTEVAGGNSFNNATVLSPGQTITDTVNGAERRYFAVPVEEGQNLRVKWDIAKPKTSEALHLKARNPLRLQMPFSSTNNQNTTTGDLFGQPWPDGVSLQATLARPILSKNLDGPAEAREFSFGGMQYLVVARSWNEESGTVALPYTLTVDVWGEPGKPAVELVTNEQEYRDQFEAEEETPSPSPSPSQSPTAAPSDTPESTETHQPDAGSDDTSSPLPWVIGLGSVGGLLVVGGVAWFVIARARSRRSG